MTTAAVAVWPGSWTTRDWPHRTVEFTTRATPRPDAMRVSENMGPAMRPGMGRGVIDVEFRRLGGEWGPCTGCGGLGTRGVIIPLHPETDIASFMFHVRDGFGIIDVQISFRDGSRTPPAFGVSQDDLVTTHEVHIPHNEYFAGLRLRVQGPDETRRGRPSDPIQTEPQYGGYGVVDAAVMRTGWLTCNQANASTHAARWPAEGVAAFLLREQISYIRGGLVSRGIVDLCVVRPDGATDCLTGNPSFTREHRIPIGGRTLCGIKVWETPHCGLTDMVFSFTDGSTSSRAFEDSDHGVADAARTWTGPTRAYAGAALGPHGWTPRIVGVDVREQPHYGLIDILPVTANLSPRSDSGTLGARPAPPAAAGTPESEPWLVVSRMDIGTWLRHPPRTTPALGGTQLDPGLPGPWTGAPVCREASAPQPDHRFTRSGREVHRLDESPDDEVDTYYPPDLHPGEPGPPAADARAPPPRRARSRSGGASPRADP